MKLSKPEEMDEFGEQAEKQSGDVDPSKAAEMAAGDEEIEAGGVRTVEAFGDEIEIEQAVEVIAEMVEEPEHFGMATSAEVRELRETVADQEKVISELLGVVGTLVQNRGGSVDWSSTAQGIYDPTTEFENGN